ncbi:MAG: hypothetical protein GY756_02485, partial [bacterium]|nr:hypothetical protein [bacterium]
MNEKILLFIVLLTSFWLSEVSAQPYTLTVKNGQNYSPLPAANKLQAPPNGYSWTVNTGITFKIFGSTINSSVDLENLGAIDYSFNEVPADYGYGHVPFINLPYDGSSVEAYVTTDNINGQNIFKAEWVYTLNNGDSFNQQLWLYEGSDIIEIHIGPNNISQESINNEIFNYEFGSVENGPYISFSKGNTEYIDLTGNAAAPVIGLVYQENLSSVPPNGTVYVFTPSNSPCSGFNLTLGKTEVKCKGGNDGTITASTTGGTGAVSYTLNGGNAQQTTTFN